MEAHTVADERIEEFAAGVRGTVIRPDDPDTTTHGRCGTG